MDNMDNMDTNMENPTPQTDAGTAYTDPKPECAAAGPNPETGSQAPNAQAPNAQAPNAQAPNAQAPNAQAPNAGASSAASGGSFVYTDPNTGATYTGPSGESGGNGRYVYEEVPKQPRNEQMPPYSYGNSSAAGPQGDGRGPVGQQQGGSYANGSGWQTGAGGQGSYGGYGQSAPNGYHSYSSAGGYPGQGRPDAGMDTTPLTMGEWLLTLLPTLIPCVSLVLYLIWAFSNTGNLHRRNFCRAYLIIMAISAVISMLFMIVVIVAGVGAAGSMYY